MGARGLGQATLLQLGARLEGFDTALHAVDVGVGAVKENRDGGANFVAERCLGGRKGRLGDEFVVLESLGQLRSAVVGEEEAMRTRTVFSTFTRRGKSDTPAPRVETELSRWEREFCSDRTQSPYEAERPAILDESEAVWRGCDEGEEATMRQMLPCDGLGREAKLVGAEG